jgi:hypothetical protein
MTGKNGRHLRRYEEIRKGELDCGIPRSWQSLPRIGGVARSSAIVYLEMDERKVSQLDGRLAPTAVKRSHNGIQWRRE